MESRLSTRQSPPCRSEKPGRPNLKNATELLGRDGPHSGKCGPSAEGRVGDGNACPAGDLHVRRQQRPDSEIIHGLTSTRVLAIFDRRVQSTPQILSSFVQLLMGMASRAIHEWTVDGLEPIRRATSDVPPNSSIKARISDMRASYAERVKMVKRLRCAECGNFVTLAVLC